MTLFDLETIKVPITDTILAVNSYTEVWTSKPYIACSNDYVFNGTFLKLRMSNQLWHSYYCEKLFLVKHKSKHGCKSAFTITCPRKLLMNTALSKKKKKKKIIIPQ